MPNCFDAYGQVVPEFPDEDVTEEMVNAWIDAVPTVPKGSRAAFQQCINPFYEQFHFGEGGDNIFLLPAPDGSLKVSTLDFDYGDLTGYPGLDFPPHL